MYPAYPDAKGRMTRREAARYFGSVLVCCALAGWFRRAGAASDGSKCPVCGCEANHCDAGIPEHLRCSRATEAQKDAIRRRRKKVEDAANFVVGQGLYVNACNETVVEFAYQLGYATSFPAMDQLYVQTPPFNADRMTEYLGSSKAAGYGWKMLDPDQALQYADAGQFVVGAIHSADVNGVYGPLPERQAHGHVFVVLPGDYSTGANATKDLWRKMNIVDSALGSTNGVQRRIGGDALRRGVRPSVKFFVLEHPRDLYPQQPFPSFNNH